jgi:lysyl-tRNA synthetase class 2
MYLEQNKLAWDPSATLTAIKQRANLLQQIRDFFAQRNVVEVDTPLLCQHGVTSPHLEPIQVGSRFLQTSPEYAMKRLLAAGAGDIFQICKAFREEELGSLHNPEFTILEWYRLGQNHHQLMAEIDKLLHHILASNSEQFNQQQLTYTTDKISYREIFKQYLHCDPLLSSVEQLQQLILDKINLSIQLKKNIINFTKQDCQEFLFSNCIEPHLQQIGKIQIIYNYPSEQAALAKIVLDQDGEPIAERFEVYVNGIELANGYHELTDPDEQHHRFLAEQKMRSYYNKKFIPIDPLLLAALQAGMPHCSGVALGIDRLLMITTNNKSIRNVINFCWDRA